MSQRHNPNADLTVVYSSDPADGVRRITEAMAPFAGLSSDANVVIKPNLVVSRTKWLGANTRPEVVEALIVALRERGVERITVADGSGMGESATRAFGICGYDEIARKHGVRLVDIEHDDFIERKTRSKGPFSRLRISRTVAECDFLINVPLIKAHGQTRVTCSLKNLKGVMPRRSKTSFHLHDTERAIAQLGEVVTPDFILVDGTYGDVSSELGGNPVNIGIIAGGYDPLALDCFAATTLGFSPQEIKHIAHYARARGVDLESFEPRIHKLNSPSGATVFEADRGDLSRYRSTVHAGNVCSTCWGNLRFALERLRKARLLERSDHYFIGRNAVERLAGNDERRGGSSSKQWMVAVGDCARSELTAASGAESDTEITIAGCPPRAEAIVSAVRGAKR
ncbi:MAG: DUF362 domain-containing protein [Spirochaetota bacterium]